MKVKGICFMVVLLCGLVNATTKLKDGSDEEEQNQDVYGHLLKNIHHPYNPINPFNVGNMQMMWYYMMMMNSMYMMNMYQMMGANMYGGMPYNRGRLSAEDEAKLKRKLTNQEINSIFDQGDLPYKMQKKINLQEAMSQAEMNSQLASMSGVSNKLFNWEKKLDNQIS